MKPIRNKNRYFLITFAFRMTENGDLKHDIIGITHTAFPTFQEQTQAVWGAASKAAEIFPVCCNEIGFHDMERWKSSLETKKKSPIIKP